MALVNNLLGVIRTHFADDHAHKAKDNYALGLVTIQNVTGAVDLLSCAGTLQFLSSALGDHVSSSVFHQNADIYRGLTGSLGQTQDKVNYFANAMKTFVNGHINDGPVIGRIRIT